MKILWFETSQPARYLGGCKQLVVRGWQDALEELIRQHPEIELFVAFESEIDYEMKSVDGVTYIPIHTYYSFFEKKKRGFSWKVNENKVVNACVPIVNSIKPDLIHVFGNEWPYGLITEYINVPVVIHIQGSIIPYDNAYFPPGYNICDLIRTAGLNLRHQYHVIRDWCNEKSRLEMEKRIWKAVNHYMGRTCWDRALVNVLHSTATYHHVEEALRPEFMETTKRWTLKDTNRRLKIVTTGCSSFWKGVDVMLKTAHILKTNGIDFEWNVAGSLPLKIRNTVERKEKLKFSDNNIRILGYISPSELIDLLCDCTLYVHTAYIENSPNSICEAQYLGVPIVSTMVGGISSLIRNEQDGILLPANDPWQIANAIIELSKDNVLLNQFSSNSYASARKRHSPENIVNQLLDCYRALCKM